MKAGATGNLQKYSGCLPVWRVPLLLPAIGALTDVGSEFLSRPLVQPMKQLHGGLSYQDAMGVPDIPLAGEKGS